MDRLEGYNTTGHEYRMSQIDRNNSQRLKWMMDEAKKNVEKAQKAKKLDSLAEENEKDQSKSINYLFDKQAYHPESINHFNSLFKKNLNNK